MKFMLVNGVIKFPNWVAKNGFGFVERPEDETLCERIELTAVNQPSQAILDAVEGKYFERYAEARAYLDSIGG